MSTRHRHSSLLIAAFLLTACTSGASPTSPDGSGATDAPPASEAAGLPSTAGGGNLPHACDLLSVSEIEGVVGNPVEEGSGITTSDCSWGSDPNEVSAALQTLWTGTQQICTDALEDDPDEVVAEGLGAPAFWLWSPIQGGAGTISVCRENGDFILTTVAAGLDDTPDEAGIRAMAESLAQLVLGRI